MEKLVRITYLQAVSAKSPGDFIRMIQEQTPERDRNDHITVSLWSDWFPDELTMDRLMWMGLEIEPGLDPDQEIGVYPDDEID